MNKNEYMSYHKSMCDRMVETTRKKNADYTGKTDDPFANFRRCEQLNICSVEVGFLTRMTDKMARINSLIQNGKALVEDESIEDTLIDLANYSILMAGYLASKRRAERDKALDIPPELRSLKKGDLVKMSAGTDAAAHITGNDPPKSVAGIRAPKSDMNMGTRRMCRAAEVALYNAYGCTFALDFDYAKDQISAPKNGKAHPPSVDAFLEGFQAAWADGDPARERALDGPI